MKRFAYRARWAAWVLLLASAGCTTEEKPPAIANTGLPDAQLPPNYDSGFDGTYEDHMTIPIDPLDRVDTEPTPLVDLPLVVARPRGPLSTSTIQVLVLSPEGLPVGDIGVAAGGPMVFTNAFGIAHILSVYGEQIAEVYAYGGVQTLGHARVPIRDAEQSFTVIEVAPLEFQRVEDISAEGDSITPPPPPPPPLPDGSIVEDAGMTEAPEPQTVTVAFPSDAFELPWGQPAKGPAFVLSARLSEPAQAGAVPGAMIGIVNDARVPLDAMLTFELRITQGRNELTLLKDVEATVLWPEGHVPDVAAELPTLYYFDPDRGAFVERGTLRNAGDAAIATLDRTGHWLLGAPANETHCTRVALHESGNPIVHAGVLVVGESDFTAARVETDALGEACGLLEGSGNATVEAVGQGALGIVRGSGPAVLSTAPMAACTTTDCGLAQLDAEGLGNTCVRGRASSALYPDMSVLAGPTEDSLVYIKSVPVDEEFCLDVPADSVVMVQGCGESMSTGSTGGFCGDDGCLDLGTFQCCVTWEACGQVVPTDDDCDDTIDEGCECGGASCGDGRTEGCCTPSDVCGMRSPLTDQCVAPDGQFFSPGICPSAMVPTELGNSIFAVGCCRLEGRCGLDSGILAFGCVAPENIEAVWGPGIVFSETTCTP